MTQELLHVKPVLPIRIWTCFSSDFFHPDADEWREETWDMMHERSEKAVSWCRDQDLEFDAVNDNLPEVIEKYGNNSRKVSCDYYIDDRAILPETIRA